MRTIKLARGVKNDVPYYKVLTVKNSTIYNPGDELCKREVDDLCGNARWDVTIVSLNESKENRQ
jgi:hypothetical protein